MDTVEPQILVVSNNNNDINNIISEYNDKNIVSPHNNNIDNSDGIYNVVSYIQIYYNK